MNVRSHEFCVRPACVLCVYACIYVHIYIYVCVFLCMDGECFVPPFQFCVLGPTTTMESSCTMNQRQHAGLSQTLRTALICTAQTLVLFLSLSRVGQIKVYQIKFECIGVPMEGSDALGATRKNIVLSPAVLERHCTIEPHDLRSLHPCQLSMSILLPAPS